MDKEHAWHDWNLKLPALAVLLIALTTAEKDGQVFSIDSNKDPLNPPVPRGLFKDESI